MYRCSPGRKSVVTGCTGAFCIVVGPPDWKSGTIERHSRSCSHFTTPTVTWPCLFEIQLFCQDNPPVSHRVYPATKRCVFNKISSTTSPLEMSFFLNCGGPHTTVAGSVVLWWLWTCQIKVHYSNCLGWSMSRFRGTSPSGDSQLSHGEWKSLKIRRKSSAKLYTV